MQSIDGFKKPFVTMPRQKVPKSQKNKKWKEATIDALIGLSSFSPGGYNGRDLLSSTYKYYNGVVDSRDFTHVLKPYGKQRSNFPAELHNYNIIKPIVDLLIGEFQKRPFNYTVTISNPDVVTKKEKQLQEVVKANLMQHFINELNDKGVETGIDSAEIPPPEEIVEIFNRSYKDNRAIMGENALNFIMMHQELIDKWGDAFFHFLVSGIIITEKSIVNDEVIYDVLNPLEVDYDISPNVKYIEDGNYAIRRRECHLSDIIDDYYEDLTPAQIDRLENPKDIAGTNFLDWGTESAADDRSKTRLIEVYKVYWKSRKRIGILSFTDENGLPDEVEVEDGYIPGEGESVEWLWVNEEWTGTRIDDDIYLRVEPTEKSDRSMDNKSKCKLSINGRRYSDINAPNISLVMLGIPYQIAYNIYHYRLDLSIAKAKGMIATIDISMVPENLTPDQWLYYIDSTGIAFLDSSQEGAGMSPQQQMSLDLTFKEIESYVALLDFMLSSWERLSGVTRQRQGAIGQYDAVGTTEQSIIQSSHITEDYFAKANKLFQRDCQGLIDLSKIAWINGKKGQYVMPDFTVEYLNVDGIDHAESEYGIFVTGDPSERQKIEALRQLAQPLIQSGAPLSTIAELYELDNFAQLKNKIKETEDYLARKAEENAAKQAEMEQQAAQAQMQVEQVKMENDNQQKELDRQNEIQVALINAEGRIDPGENAIKDKKVDRDYDINKRKIDADNRKAQADLRLKKQELQQEDRHHKSEIEVKKMQAKKTSNSTNK